MEIMHARIDSSIRSNDLYLKEENYVVNEEVHLEIARYFKLIGNKEQAYEYYLKCFKSYSSVLGHKTALLSEALDSFNEMNDDANSSRNLNNLRNKLHKSIKKKFTF